jgi:transcription elongation GreA/GreB family factor
VAIGSAVAVEDRRSGRVDRYRIIGPLETGGEGAVSAGSAVGEALLGMEAGAVVTVELPRGGARTLRILAVEEPPPGADGRSA